MTEIEITRRTGRAARDSLPVVGAIYTEVYAEPLFASYPFFRASDFPARYLRNVARPGFELLVAHQAGTEVGCLYGYRLVPDTHWWEGMEWFEEMSGDLTPNFSTEHGSRTVVIPQLMVRQQFRRAGIARLLHDSFLAGRTEYRAGLRVLPENVPARTAYLAWGWTPYGLVRPSPEAPVFECLVKNLRPADAPTSRPSASADEVQRTDTDDSYPNDSKSED
jgi:GNAT superfamily N-acetyltransferase